MSPSDSVRVQRWTPLSVSSVAVSVAVLVVLAFGPALFSPNFIDKLTTLFIYILLAAT